MVSELFRHMQTLYSELINHSFITIKRLINIISFINSTNDFYHIIINDFTTQASQTIVFNPNTPKTINYKFLFKQNLILNFYSQTCLQNQHFKLLFTKQNHVIKLQKCLPKIKIPPITRRDFLSF